MPDVETAASDEPALTSCVRKRIITTGRPVAPAERFRGETTKHLPPSALGSALRREMLT
jgi:hypothetical protein